MDVPRRNTTIGHDLTYPARTIPAPPLQEDNSQYLQFLPPVMDTPIFDSKLNSTSIGLTGHLSGQFSLSPTGPSEGDEEKSSPHSDKSPSPDKNAASQLELTFYRRNLFQVSCNVTNARSAVYAMCSGPSGTESQRSRIIGLSMKVSVSGSDESKMPKLIYTPPKPVARKQEQEPAIKPVWPKDSGSEVVDWKRLQFRSATAHNGRRRLQNYFTLTVALYAELENCQRVCLVHANSRPIVVRGRNPLFYSNRQTIAISDTAAHVRDNTTLISYSSSAASATPALALKDERKSPLSSSDDDSDSNKPSLSVNEDSDTGSKTKKAKLNRHMIEAPLEEDGYQYYPMPPLYYQEPVEVVYRPHAVMHMASVESSMKRAYAMV